MKDFCKPVRSNSLYIGEVESHNHSNTNNQHPNNKQKKKGWESDPFEEYTTDNCSCSCFGKKRRKI